MKAGITLLSIGILSSAAAVTSGAAERTSETRSVADFEAIEVGGSITLHVQQGPAFRVAVDGADGPASEIVTEVRGNTLHVHHDRAWFPFFSGWWFHAPRHTVDVTMPRLVRLGASGGTDVSSRGPVAGDTLEVSTSGGAKVRLDVAVDMLDVRTSGGSDLWLSGHARAANLRSSGGSDLDARRLTADSARVTGSGGSDIWIGESASLVANASGGSDIRYDGEPRSLVVNKSGGGGVRRGAGP
jgi:hypothetical protein